MRVEAPISVGELIDKITILELKCARIADLRKAAQAIKELSELEQVLKKVGSPPLLVSHLQELREVNARLWEMEDKIRQHDERQDFGQEFVAVARGIHQENDRRYAIKRKINELMGSTIVEVKSYRSSGEAHE